MGYMKIIYRTWSKNDDVDALSRRESFGDLTEKRIIDNPILKKKVEKYDAGLSEKDLEESRESLMEMTHLRCAKLLIEDLCNWYLQDSSFNGISLPAGVIHDPNTGLHCLTC